MTTAEQVATSPVEGVQTEAFDGPLHKPGVALCKISRILGILTTAALLLAVNYEVFSRSVMNQPTTWVTEYSAYLVVAITFLGAAFVQLRGAHVRVTVLTDLLSGSASARLASGVSWVGVALMIVLAWKTTEFVYNERVADTRNWSMLNTPMWVPMSVVAIGYFGLMVALLVETRKYVARNISAAKDWAGRIIILAVLVALCMDAFSVSGVKISTMQGAWLVAASTLLASALWGGASTAMRYFIYALIPIGLYYVVQDVSLVWQGLTLTLMLMYFLATGLQVAYSLTAIGFLGLVLWMPKPILAPLAVRAWESVHYFEFTAIPTFVFMGCVLARTDAAQRMFIALLTLFGRTRGSLAFSTIGASGIFAAVSGSSVASAATLGRVAGPQLTSHGYTPALSYGLIAAGGTLGILIPPSVAMIVYGSLAGVPVTQLFLAGMVPGFLVMLLFALAILIWMVVSPKSIPSGRAYTMKEKVASASGVIPFIALIACVLGSLYSGIATPTEAGAVGSVGAVLVAGWRRQLSVSMIVRALEETALTTSFLLLIAAGAAQMSYVLDALGMATSLVDYLGHMNLPQGMLMIGIVIAYLILGMFIEPISMMLLTLPVVLPLIASVGWDPLWFGVVLVILVEIGLITPPVGMLLFVLQGVTEGKVDFKQISVGAAPFVFVLLSAIAILYWFPALVTWLPGFL